MRKKELINENKFISEELKRLKENNEALKAELDGKSEEIKLLNEKIEKLNEVLNSKENDNEAEAKEETEPIEQGPSILDYGAVIIGKVLISAAEYCGRINSQNEERANAAVNEIFERTEAVKSEILSIISTDDSYDKKSQLMEREYHAAVSFFDRTVARV